MDSIMQQIEKVAAKLQLKQGPGRQGNEDEGNWQQRQHLIRLYEEVRRQHQQLHGRFRTKPDAGSAQPQPQQPDLLNRPGHQQGDGKGQQQQCSGNHRKVDRFQIQDFITYSAEGARPDKDYFAFEQHARLIIEAQQYPFPEVGPVILSLMRGRAAQAVAPLVGRCYQFPNLDAFFDKLRSIHITTEIRDQARAAFVKRTQYPGESVKDFFLDLRSLWKTAVLAPIDDESALIHQFLNGLRISGIPVSRMAKEFDSAEQALEEVQKLLRSNRNLEGMPPVHHCHPPRHNYNFHPMTNSRQRPNPRLQNPPRDLCQCHFHQAADRFDHQHFRASFGPFRGQPRRQRSQY